MIVYANDYTTFDRVNRQIRMTLTDTDVVDDIDTFRGYITDASRFFQEQTQRTFVPYTFTHEIEYRSRHFSADERFLWLPDDCLAITSVTNTDGSTIASSQYRFRYQYETPNQQMELLPNARISTYSSDAFTNRYEIAGIWGYHTDYSNAWVSVSHTVTVDDATETTITFNEAPAELERLHYIKVDDEILQVTGALDGTEVVVKRGVNGTTAAAHTAGSAVAYWDIEPQVTLAVTRLVCGLYRTRHNAGQQLRFVDGSVLVEGDEKSMTRIEKRLKKKTRIRGT